MKSKDLLNYEIAVIGIPLISIENPREVERGITYFQKLKSVMLLMGYAITSGPRTYLFSYFTSIEINIGKEFLVVANTVYDNEFIDHVSTICNHLGQNSFYHIKKENKEISMINTSQNVNETNTIDISLTNVKITEIEHPNTSTVFTSFVGLQVMSKGMAQIIGRPILKELNIIPFHK